MHIVEEQHHRSHPAELFEKRQQLALHAFLGGIPGLLGKVGLGGVSHGGCHLQKPGGREALEQTRGLISGFAAHQAVESFEDRQQAIGSAEPL